jgi:CheY-like chemotaxis protein
MRLHRSIYVTRRDFLMHKRTNNNKITSNNNDHHSYPLIGSTTNLQKEITTDVSIEEKISFSKRILIVDDDPDMTSVFSIGLQDEGFEAYTYNDPLEALSNFKPYFYDLLLVDINMPEMNGFELCTEILKMDVNVRICFITAGETNLEVLREAYPTISVGCYIKKPITIDQLIRRIKAELD